MISTKVLSIALLAIIMVFIILMATGVFQSSGTAWLEWTMIFATLALGGWVSARRHALRSNRNSSLKRSRDSLLKWRWEERHSREW